MKRLTILALAVVAMAGCSKDDNATIDGGDSNVVTFSAGSLSRVTTVAVKDEVGDGSTDYDYWEYDDKINIITDGFDGVNTATDYANVKYVSDIEKEGDTAASTGFKYDSGNSEIVFPNVAGNTSTVDFYACYPYTTYDTTDALYKVVSIAGQVGDYGSVDFMTASAAKFAYGSTATSKTVNFTFSHELAKVVITVSLNNNLSSLDGLTTSVNKIYNSRAYDLSGNLYAKDTNEDPDTQYDTTTETAIYLTTVVASDKKTATVTAILHPMAATDCPNATINFSVTEGSRTFSVPFNVLLTAGYIHNYSIDLGNDYPEFKSGSTITDWNKYNNGTATELIPTETTSSN